MKKITSLIISHQFSCTIYVMGCYVQDILTLHINYNFLNRAMLCLILASCFRVKKKKMKKLV